MDSESRQAVSRELIRVEALMSDVPSILQLKAKKKPAGQKGSTFKPPPSSILEKARSFLPQMAKANEDMEKQLSNLPPGALDIERIEGEEGPLIEMNIALVERDDSETDSESDDRVSDDTTDDELDSEECRMGSLLCTHSNTEGNVNDELTQDNIKLPGKASSLKMKPGIEVLASDTSTDSGKSLK